jgi:hypothetical protein
MNVEWSNRSFRPPTKLMCDRKTARHTLARRKLFIAAAAAATAPAPAPAAAATVAFTAASPACSGSANVQMPSHETSMGRRKQGKIENPLRFGIVVTRRRGPGFQH